MPTINQLIRKGRKKVRYNSKSPALQGNPQLSGTVLKVMVISPMKPNSANRPIAKVQLSNGRVVGCHLPGEGFPQWISEHSQVLVRGGRTPDLPGFKYKVIGGAIGIHGADGNMKSVKPRRQQRSKYGVPKNVKK